MQEWEIRWAAGEPFGASSDITEQPSYGFGDLDNHGFFEVPVPAAFAEAHAEENKARWDARRTEHDAFNTLHHAFGGDLFI